MGQVSQVLGLLGTVTVGLGYLPQIRHLARERCSAGVSIVAWQVWLLASLLIFTHAFEVFDLVFITLQTVQIVAIVSIISLARRYRNLTCTFHANLPAARSAFRGLAGLQIDERRIWLELETEGAEKFSSSYGRVLNAVEKKEELIHAAR